MRASNGLSPWRRYSTSSTSNSVLLASRIAVAMAIPPRVHAPGSPSPTRHPRSKSDDAEVLELPRVLAIEVLREQPAAILQRRPVAVSADHRPEIGHADLEVAVEIHLVSLD